MMLTLILIAAGVALGVLVLVAVRSSLRNRRVHASYDRYARDLLAEHFQLAPSPVRKGFQILRPWKALGLFTVAGTLLRGERFAWVNISNTTMAGFMKLHTFFFRGGPAVDMLERLMGPEKMRVYARTVMFGLEA